MQSNEELIPFLPAALQRMVDAKTWETLSSGDQHSCITAVVLLSNLGRPEHVRLLHRMLPQCHKITVSEMCRLPDSCADELEKFLPSILSLVDHGRAPVREATLAALSSLRPRFHARAITKAIGRLDDRVEGVRTQAYKAVLRMGPSFEAQHMPSIINKVITGRCSMVVLEKLPTALIASHAEALHGVYDLERLVDIVARRTVPSQDIPDTTPYTHGERLHALRALKAHFAPVCRSEQIELLLRSMTGPYGETEMLELLAGINVTALRPNAALLFDLVASDTGDRCIVHDKMLLLPIFSPIAASPQLASAIAAHFDGFGVACTRYENALMILEIVDASTLRATPKALGILEFLFHKLRFIGRDGLNLLRKLGPDRLREHATVFVQQLLQSDSENEWRDLCELDAALCADYYVPQIITRLEVATGKTQKCCLDLLHQLSHACLCSTETITALCRLVSSAQLNRREHGLRCLLRLIAKEAPATGLTLLSEAFEEVHRAISEAIRGLPDHHTICKLAERLIKTVEAPGGLSRQRQDSEFQAALPAELKESNEEEQDWSADMQPQPKRSRIM